MPLLWLTVTRLHIWKKKKKTQLTAKTAGLPSPYTLRSHSSNTMAEALSAQKTIIRTWVQIRKTPPKLHNFFPLRWNCAALLQHIDGKYGTHCHVHSLCYLHMSSSLAPLPSGTPPVQHCPWKWPGFVHGLATCRQQLPCRMAVQCHPHPRHDTDAGSRCCRPWSPTMLFHVKQSLVYSLISHLEGWSTTA